MKKFNLLLISMLFVIFVFIIGWRGTYSSASSTYSRSELQDFVVSTALSYYYNKDYSDYDQKSMDEVGDTYSSFNWRNVTNSPEMVNRTNEYNIDCSSFILMTYLHSLGYDMSEYRSYFRNSYFLEDYEWKNMNSSKVNYEKGYSIYGKGFNTADISNVADLVSGHNGKVGDEYINNKKTNTSSVVYHYNVDLSSDYSYNESSSRIEEIRNNIIETLQSGDILVYRRKNISTGDETGHVILYVGDIFNSLDKGFIHATGKDYDPDSDPITIGDDDYSVRYDTWDDMFKDNIFIDDDETVSSQFTIIRPINTYCEKDSCTVDIDSNVIARNELSKLRVEQYVSTPEKDVVSIISKYNSVNNGDKIKYNLVLTNMSKFNYCQKGSPSYDTQEDCESKNYDWKTTNNSEIIYIDLVVIGEIPSGTDFVDCSDNCIYNKEDNTVTWNVADINPNNYDKLTYTVVVNTKDNIVNPGIKIVNGNSQLVMGELITKINITINEDYNIKNVKDNVDKFSKLVNKGKITFNSSTSKSDYKLDLDEITEAEISKLGFIKSIYYNSFGMNLGFLSSSNIKNAIFNIKDGIYTKKTDSQVESLSDTSYQNINKMLVKGMYGGRLLKGNDNKDRARFLKSSYLEFGDIIITFNKDNLSSLRAYLFLGYDSTDDSIFVEYNKNSSGDAKVLYYDINKNEGKTGYRLFKEIFAQGLFVILRPSQLYGTINIDYDNNYVTRLPIGMTVFELQNKINISQGNIKIINKFGNEKDNNDLLCTGDILSVYNNDEKTGEFVISVLGDVNGDGKINSLDLVILRKHIVEYKNPETGLTEIQTGVYKLALDVSDDNNINSLDIVKIRKKIVGLE